MTEALSSNKNKPALGERAGALVGKYELDEKQGERLAKLEVENPGIAIDASYSILHDWISRNFAKELSNLLGTSSSLGDEEAMVYGLDIENLKNYSVFTLKSEVALPNGLMLQPGSFVYDQSTDKIVRGLLEIRNAQDKGMGIRFSQCHGKDMPVYFSRDDRDSVINEINWNCDDSAEMTAIRDAWTKDTKVDLTKLESVIIGMMQENNKRSAEANARYEQASALATERIKNLLDL